MLEYVPIKNVNTSLVDAIAPRELINTTGAAYVVKMCLWPGQKRACGALSAGRSIIYYNPAMPIDDDMREAIDRAARSGRIKSLEDMRELTSNIMFQHNRQPQPELCGLSPEQAHKLIDFEWESPPSAVRLNHSLALAELTDVTFLNNARVFLEWATEKRIKATVSGNLNRKTVARMLDELTWEDDHLQFILDRGKVLNEEDVLPLHFMRVLLGLAGMIKKRNGYFSSTARGAKMLAPDKAGELYASLFKTCFTKLNLAYLDGAPANEALQAMVVIPLYILHRLDDSWYPLTEVRDRVWPAIVRAHSFESEHFDFLLSQTKTRLLKPLSWFGMVEIKRDNKEYWSLEKSEVRKTPLYGRILNFDFSSSTDIEPIMPAGFDPDALPN